MGVTQRDAPETGALLRMAGHLPSPRQGRSSGASVYVYTALGGVGRPSREQPGVGRPENLWEGQICKALWSSSPSLGAEGDKFSGPFSHKATKKLSWWASGWRSAVLLE